MRRSLFHYDVLDSTMKEYERLHVVNNKQGKIVLADRQSQGLGRGTNQWYSSMGGLWFTFDLDCECLVDSFALFIGACLHRSLSTLFSCLEVDLKIKWPNDLYVKDKKLAGILCKYLAAESRYVVGVGINTNNKIEDPDLELKTAVLSDLFFSQVSNRFLMSLLIDAIDRELTTDNKSSYIDYCNNHLYGRNREAVITLFDNSESGRVHSIATDGSLLLLMGNDVLKRFNAGGLLIKTEKKL